jgi:hypothetical protein
MKAINLLKFQLVVVLALFQFCGSADISNQQREMKTEVTIVGQQFYINGEPTYKGRTWTTSYGGEYPVEGLLMNARLVQGIFDDLNPETQGQWAYPDTKEWDPDRNTSEFIDAMASWKENGLLAFTLNLQGGCPYGYCRQQPWDNSAFAPDGSLRPDFMNRLERILNHADDLGMVVILGYYYFGQDGNMDDEQSIIRSVEEATRWVLEKGYRNVIIEVNNECDVAYRSNEILQCHRVHELIELVKSISLDGRRLYVSTSLGGKAVPPANIVGASDYVLLHGNGVRHPERIEEMIKEVRSMDVYANTPVVFNEDDQPWRHNHQGWGESGNNFVVAVKNYASWGNFDFRLDHEHHDYNLGHQSIPANWHITTEREKGFFKLLADITGSPGAPTVAMEFSKNIGDLEVIIENERLDSPVTKVEVLVNNRVVGTLDAKPFTFSLPVKPDKEHWVKARAHYISDGTPVIIESLYLKNPWWPYGGPARD